MGKVLEVKDLEVAYGGITALHGISLDVDEGEIVTLIGANGAGKSTTLRAISGMIPLRRGSVRLVGKEIGSAPSHSVARLGLAHVPEGRGIFPNLTVRDNLLIAAYPRKDREGVKADLERVFGLFPRLREREKQMGGTLSGGEQQMLAVGRALMTKSRVILLDEPSMGLAPVLVRSIFEVIKEINKQGATILLVEQNALQALRIAHRGYVLQTGRIVLAGSGTELNNHPEVKKAYLGG
ncbi:MAG: ABC transporter ATP-binding protein [Actinobacteria bacterium]|nr:ABC transporter ATP-binding protein [Actinomycetota bacterium]